jgi:integrase
MIKKRLVSNKSKPYPRDSKFNSPNQLTKPFLETFLPKYDKAMTIKNFYTKKLSCVTSKHLYYLYCYLRYFHYYPLSVDALLHISRHSVRKAGTRYFLIYPVDQQSPFTPIKVYLLESFIGSQIEAYFNRPMNLTEFIDHLFEENDGHDQKFKKFLKRTGLTVDAIINAVALNVQLNKSPLTLTLLQSREHPGVNVSELEKMFPGLVPSHLLEKQNKNLEFYFGMDLKDESDDEYDVVEYLERDIDYYEALKRTTRLPAKMKQQSVELTKVLHKLDMIKSDEQILIFIKKHLQFMIHKALEGDIVLKTLREYLRISFNYCYLHVVREGSLNQKVLRMIEARISGNNKLTLQTQRYYKRLVNEFFSFSDSAMTTDKVYSLIDIRRSYIFKDELIEILTRVRMLDAKKEYRAGTKKVCIAMRQVFLLLLYYGGFRKTELRTRRMIDVDLLGNNEVVIDVNFQSMKETMKSTGEGGLSLKSDHAKRRVRFYIDDAAHYELIKFYITAMKKSGYKFLFPILNDRGRLSKKHVIKARHLDGLSDIVKSVTNRYTPLHSFRHTFATNNVLEILKNRHTDTHALYELCRKIGHGDPKTTIDNYVHIEIVMLLHDIMSQKNLTAI